MAGLLVTRACCRMVESGRSNPAGFSEPEIKERRAVLGGRGSGRTSKREYASRAHAVNQLNGLLPQAIRNARRFLQDEDPKIRWMATQWVLEKATGKPRQEIAVATQERVQVEIRIVGADGLPLDDAQPGVIDAEGRELPPITA